jgi:hypothetical protein
LKSFPSARQSVSGGEKRLRKERRTVLQKGKKVLRWRVLRNRSLVVLDEVNAESKNRHPSQSPVFDLVQSVRVEKRLQEHDQPLRSSTVAVPSSLELKDKTVRLFGASRSIGAVAAEGDVKTEGAEGRDGGELDEGNFGGGDELRKTRLREAACPKGVGENAEVLTGRSAKSRSVSLETDRMKETNSRWSSD